VNLGTPDDYRVPDLTVAPSGLDVVWVEAATMVVEVVSPDEDGTAKLPFYRPRVAEVLVVEPERQRLTLFAGLDVVADSAALGFTPGDLAAHLGW
jgi:Uma2 family endonuclease